MKPRIFLDTNIMLDLIQERPDYEACARVLQRQEDGKIEVCLSVLSMANIAYVLRKTVPPFLVIPTLKQISSVVRIVSMDAHAQSAGFPYPERIVRRLFLAGSPYTGRIPELTYPPYSDGGTPNCFLKEVEKWERVLKPVM